MTPAEIRNARWLTIQSRLHGLRQLVYHQLLAHGARTTRVLAAEMNLDLLTVRPRVTELHQLGLVDCVGRDHGEGVYAAINETAWRARQVEEEEKWGSEQCLLKLK